MNWTWLYLFCGMAALYTVETADANQSLQFTALEAFLLCVAPMTIEALWSSNKLRKSADAVQSEE